MRNALRASLIISMLVLGLGCGSLGGSSSRGEGGVVEGVVVEGVGRIHYVDLEGGFYGITTEGGARYLPSNLPANLHRHDTAVRFRGRLRTDAMTIRMWGTSLHVEEIEILEPLL